MRISSTCLGVDWYTPTEPMDVPLFTLSIATRVAARRAGISPESCSVLAEALSTAVDTLLRRRASAVPAVQLDAYVALRWMTWHAGSLVLTDEGRSVQAMSLQGIHR